MAKSMLDIDHPPLEDHLSRYTLWPEARKLYGHGHEISALACSFDGTLIATACKATSIDYAVIILFNTDTWQMIDPPLTAHNLTIGRLRFSLDDEWLLSVSRDRQWSVFRRDPIKPDVYHNAYMNTKAHSRMIHDCAWAPTTQPLFATAGRDKLVKLWTQEPRSDKDDGDFECASTVVLDQAATAVDFFDIADRDLHSYLAVGTEGGRFRLYAFSLQSDRDELDRVEVPLILAYVPPFFFPSQTPTFS